MQINIQRLQDNLQKMACFGKGDENQINRSVGSEADVLTRQFIIDLWQNIGLKTKVDGIANLWATTTQNTDKKPIVMGSHHDAVPDGGMYDGALGVLVASEVLNTLLENNYILKHPFKLVSFTAEEPNPYGVSTMGSRSITGKLDVDFLSTVKNPQGVYLKDTIKALGGNIETLPQNLLQKNEFASFIELHIEQGRNLFEKNLSVATVSCITGIYREVIDVIGQANHAGTTVMKDRHDAQLAACEVSLAIESIVKEQNCNDVVATVGKMDIIPNAANIIAGKAQLIVELRTPNNEIKDNLIKKFTMALDKIEKTRGVKCERIINLNQDAVDMNVVVQNAIAQGCKKVQKEEMLLVSMAGHDAVHMADIGKTGMMFVQSVNGISHSKFEHTEIKDIENAANAL